jgi:hypothetical protein
MRNLFLHTKKACGCSSDAARGLQPFEQQDLSTRTGCIERVLRDKLR